MTAVQDSIEVAGAVDQYDAIIIGGGMAGLEMLYRLNKAGLRTRLLEAGDGLGGTWHWNKYPGARSDSEIYAYGFFWDEPALLEWNWPEHYGAADDIEDYVNFAIDSVGLRDSIQLNTRVMSARFDESASRWVVVDQDGTKYGSQFLVAAPGILDAPSIPYLPGIENFQGLSFHSARWPKDLDLTGKRVAVIGTGATGVQIIQSIASEVGSLTVYQRSPNFVCPLRNAPITAEEQAQLKAEWPQIVETCKNTYIGFQYDVQYDLAADKTPEERLAYYDEIWNRPGLSKAFANYFDHYTNAEVNRYYTEYVRAKIRERITKPELVSKLVPTEIGFNYKRIPLDNGYYEVYNRDNVELVCLPENPIETVTTTGIMTTDGHREFDVIVYATGFDAVTGSMKKINIHSVDGETIRDAWRDGPIAYLTAFVPGFPNLITLTGACFGNIPRCFEATGEFVGELVTFMRENGLQRVETTVEATEAFMDESEEGGRASVINLGNSWFVGANIEGKKKRQYLYSGGVTGLRSKYGAIVASGFRDDGLRFR